ncbi:MAG: hypothetical protein RL732_1423 [Bacteroidota bacterium]
MYRQLRPFSRLFLLPFLLLSCSPSYNHYLSLYKADGLSEAPDYANLFYWAAHPDKKDPADSVPAPLKKEYRYDTTADVFFLHPTTLTDSKDTRSNGALTDAALNAKTDYSSMLYQASTFNTYRVFAPRYRQAHIRSYYMKDTAAALQAFEMAYQDIRKAFIYYLQNCNAGRPIILASHSQGSTHAIRLMKEFFDGTPLQQQLVAAWIPGMYLPEGSFRQIKACSSPDQTGCYCSWRTYRRDYDPPFTAKEKIKPVVTNPISWTTDTTWAGANENKGSILQKFNKIFYNTSDAQVHQGILWTNRPKFPGAIFLRTKNYHIGDINLYYMNIRENVAQRLQAYRSAHYR